MSHSAHHDHQAPATPGGLATSATIHCLLGCGIGEVVGDALGTGLNLSNPATIGLGILFGLIGGFGLGIRPWLRQGLRFPQAAQRVAATEGLSILVMEAAEVLIEVGTPGLMAATLTQPFYWVGMAGALLAGFLAAWPINYVLARRGIRHAEH